MNRQRSVQVFFCLLLFLASLGVRLYGIADTGLQNDEQIWHGNGGEFIKSLLGPLGPDDFQPEPAKWKLAYVDVGKNYPWPLNIAIPVKHPGIPSSFLIGLGYLFLAEGSSSWSLDLFPLEIAARIPIVLASSFFVVAFYLLSRNITGGRTAGLAAIFFIFEPSLVGYSRLARIDLGAGMSATIALLAYANDVKSPRLFYKLLAGIFYALAILHNPYPILLLPVLILWRHLFVLGLKGQNFRRYIPDLQVIGTAAVTFVVGFPNLWANPVIGIYQHIKLVFDTPHFLGEVGKGWTSPFIYLAHPILHWSPLFSFAVVTGLGAIIYMWFARKMDEEERRNSAFHVLPVLWIGVMLLNLSWPAGRKIYKNMMLIMPALALVGGYGATLVIKFLQQRFATLRDNRGYLLFIALFVLQAGLLLYHWYPYYQLMFWGSDPQQWERAELLAGGEGVKEVAEYLKSEGHGEDSVLVYIGENNMRYYHHQGPVRDSSNDTDGLSSAHWLVVLPKYTFFGLFDANYPLKLWIREHKPTKIFYLNQVEMVRLYDLTSVNEVEKEQGAVAE